MRSRDWSLVFFTTLAQWSVGIIVCLTGLILFSDDPAVIVETGLSARNPVLLALLLIAVATTSSFLHLGKPSNAPGALNNLAGSWLSREILAIGLFSVSLLLTLFSGWKSGGMEYPAYLLLVCSITGLFLLWAMAGVYLIPTIPAWNNWYTPLSFALTTLCLGLATFLLLDTVVEDSSGKPLARFYVGFLIAVLLLELLSGLLHQQQLKKMPTGMDGPVFNRGTLHRLFLARMALLSIACLAMIASLLQANLAPGSGALTWVYPVLALVFIQEIVGRFLFYLSYFRIGV